jgi:hypothetical protein
VLAGRADRVAEARAEDLGRHGALRGAEIGIDEARLGGLVRAESDIARKTL